MYILYDSTFDGLLSAAAWCFRHRVRPECLLTEFDERPLFEAREIPCERHIRHLFRRHFRERLGTGAGDAVMDTVYHAFLSEEEGIATRIWLYLELALQLRRDPADRLYEPPVAAVVGASRRVGGQAHQFLGLLRFRLAGPAFYLADFTPDYHVLPLILPHFADRLSDQNFVIRDLRRHLAAFHRVGGQISLHVLAEDGKPLTLALPIPDRNLTMPDATQVRALASADSAAQPAGPSGENQTGIVRPKTDENFSAMWQLYLQRLSIPERRNTALQQANMPKKYWKYLTEDPNASKRRDGSIGSIPP